MLHLALKEAANSTVRTRHGAVVCKGGRVFGKGFNTYKSSPTWGFPKIHSKYGNPFYTIHAEAAAIRDAVRRGIDLKGSTIFVAREGHNQMSKPCPDCQGMIESHGIRKIVYTDENGNPITEWPPLVVINWH